MARSTSDRKTVRFTRVVERSGEPHVHTLWLPPDKDPEFKRALAANRVMTVEQNVGKPDVGVVGFDDDSAQGGQFLIFPKSLKTFGGARVIGIKFDLIAQPKVVAASNETHCAPASARKTAAPAAKTRARRDDASSAKGKKHDAHLAHPADSASERGRPARRSDPKRARRLRSPHALRTTEESHSGNKSRAARETGSEIGVKPHRSTATAANAAAPKSPPKRARRGSAARQKPSSAPRADRALLREVHAAMKELQRGQAVAAYQRLERAAEKAGAPS